MWTAENITDEAIRELRSSTWGDDDGTLHDLCNVALAEHSVQCGAVMCSTECEAGVDAEATWVARARCAEILNEHKEP